MDGSGTSIQPDSSSEDRFSSLHDSIIHGILSLNDTKYAVQTCVLSKRWMDVWKSLPFLNFDRSSFANKHEFGWFVDNVFSNRRQDCDIKRFNVRWERCRSDDSVMTSVNRWSGHALRGKVEEVSILIGDLDRSEYIIPYDLLKCESLKKLEIRVSHTTTEYVKFNLPFSMNSLRLEELVICGLKIPNLGRFFSSFPALATLDTLDSYVETDNQRDLIVDSPILKRFAYTCSDNMGKIIKLCAPNLEDFFCSFWLTQDYSLEISSPLFGVGFDMQLGANLKDETAETYERLTANEKQVYATRAMKLLGVACMVKELRLSSGFLEVLSKAPELLNCQTPRFCNLLSLTLEMWFTRSSLLSVAYLLKISPGITDLFLQSKELNLAKVGNDWEAGLPIPGMLSQLKFVQMEEVVGSDAEFELLSFLLKNAKFLEKFSLYFRSCADLSATKRVITRFGNKLELVHAASSRIQMVFKTSWGTEVTKSCNQAVQNIPEEEDIVEV